MYRSDIARVLLRVYFAFVHIRSSNEYIYRTTASSKGRWPLRFEGVDYVPVRLRPKIALDDHHSSKYLTSCQFDTQSLCNPNRHSEDNGGWRPAHQSLLDEARLGEARHGPSARFPGATTAISNPEDRERWGVMLGSYLTDMKLTLSGTFSDRPRRSRNIRPSDLRSN